MFWYKIYDFFWASFWEIRRNFYEISSNLWKALSTSMAHVSIEISIDLGQKNYPHISRLRKTAVTWILARVWIFTFFLFPDSGLNLLNGFDFYFDMAWHGTPARPDFRGTSFRLRLDGQTEKGLVSSLDHFWKHTKFWYYVNSRRHVDSEKTESQMWFEPTTLRDLVGCSTTELLETLCWARVKLWVLTGTASRGYTATCWLIWTH